MYAVDVAHSFLLSDVVTQGSERQIFWGLGSVKVEPMLQLAGGGGSADNVRHGAGAGAGG